MFERWGHIVYRFRWFMVGGAAVMLAASVAAILHGGNLDAPNSSTIVESDRAANLAASELAQQSGRSQGSSMIVLFTSKELTADDPRFESALEAAVAPLQSDGRVAQVTTPYSTGGTGFVSHDRHAAIAVVDLKSGSLVAERYLASLEGEVHGGPLQVTFTGDVPLNHAFNTTLEQDLQVAELVSLPLALLLLLLIFRSGVAAGLPVVIGVMTIAGGIAGTLLVSYGLYVSQYAFNIVTLIGLGVSIDYSLMMVSRFREELEAGRSREQALARTMATAGRAITFSGVAVAVGLSSMLFFQGTFLTSLGVSGAIVVSLAVLYGLTLLPAMLAILGPRVNMLRLPWQRRARGRGFWYAIASGVMRRPVAVLVPCAVLLVTAGIPFAHLRLASSGIDALPPANQARQGYDVLVRDFAGFGSNQIDVLAYFPGGGSASGEAPADIAALRDRLSSMPGVVEVGSPILGQHVALIRVVSNLPVSSDGARAIVNGIRANNTLPGGGQVLVYGDTASDLDIINFVRTHMLAAVLFVLAVTYIVLFVMTGSLVLPLKAVTTNLLSIAASFGALVWIFQDGHLTGPLDFTPQSVDPSIPIILFALVFGLSMDYEVLLLARIQERWLATGDNRAAVAEGLERSGRLITGAAAIMIGVFLAFGLAQDVLIKSIGLGIAIAIALDATVVRALIVPSVMRLLGRWSWWAPGLAGRWRPRIEASEAAA